MSKYFTKSETQCKCGCGVDVKPELLALMDKVREAWGAPLNVNSGARCKKYNEDLRARGIPAALHSAHMEGIAIDLSPIGQSRMKEFQTFCARNIVAWNCRMENPIATTQWVHLDLRPTDEAHRIFMP